MPAPVQLYVYDLSNGLAKQLSLQLTGKQIDGIWHTSVVVYGKEVFYGQGISITSPGHSHHGKPLRVVEMGETEIEESVFNEYIEEMREVYTADKYHLLDNNCNSFTNDCVGFLTGESIPAWIKDLPADFLSTPFGAALRPTIDNMFRRPPAGVVPARPISQSSTLSDSFMQSVAQRATGTPDAQRGLPPSPHLAVSGSVVGPIQICSNMQHFSNILSTHKAVVAFFTSRTCPPCRIVEPVFERFASEKASSGVAFVKVDLGSAFGGGQIASTYSVRATPTFLFFLEGKKTHEVRGADAAEFRTQVDLLIYEAFPPHPHASLPLRTMWSLSLEPILFEQPLNFDAVQSKMFSFIEHSSISVDQKKEIEECLSSELFPYLQNKCGVRGEKEAMNPPKITSNMFCDAWSNTTRKLIASLDVKEIFPVVDLWRLALLDDEVAQWCGLTAAVSGTNPPRTIVERIVSAQRDEDEVAKSVLLTGLRMASNMFARSVLARSILLTPPGNHNASLTSLAISSLLHGDSAVRTAAASLVFNMCAFYQKPRMEALRSGRGHDMQVEGDGEWEVELLSALLEAIRVEVSSNDILHRLVASLAFLLHLSPFYELQLKPLLEVLGAQNILLGKLNGESKFNQFVSQKKELVALIEEVASKLCE